MLLKITLLPLLASLVVGCSGANGAMAFPATAPTIHVKDDSRRDDVRSLFVRTTAASRRVERIGGVR
jgi:hypothetical protein